MFVMLFICYSLSAAFSRWFQHDQHWPKPNIIQQQSTGSDWTDDRRNFTCSYIFWALTDLQRTDYLAFEAGRNAAKFVIDNSDIRHVIHKRPFDDPFLKIPVSDNCKEAKPKHSKQLEVTTISYLNSELWVTGHFRPQEELDWRSEGTSARARRVRLCRIHESHFGRSGRNRCDWSNDVLGTQMLRTCCALYVQVWGSQRRRWRTTWSCSVSATARNCPARRSSVTTSSRSWSLERKRSQAGGENVLLYMYLRHWSSAWLIVHVRVPIKM